MSGYERIGPPPVDWGVTLCNHPHCVDRAEVKLDGWPYCLTHADDEIERWVAWDLNPELVALMPSLRDR